MRKIIIAVLVVLLSLVGAVSAQAGSISVPGTNSYEKLVVNNGSKNLVFKLDAPGGECAVHYLTVKFRDRDGTRYLMDGGCYTGAVWLASLARGQHLVSCAGFTLKYSATKSTWTGKIPRTCLKKLGGAIKVTESYVDDYSAMPGEVPATKYVRQG